MINPSDPVQFLKDYYSATTLLGLILFPFIVLISVACWMFSWYSDPDNTWVEGDNKVEKEHFTELHL